MVEEIQTNPEENSLKSAGKNRKRRHRKPFNKDLIDELEKAFQLNAFVTRIQRAHIAQRYGILETKVLMWFQNRRTKEKKLMAINRKSEKLRSIKRDRIAYSKEQKRYLERKFQANQFITPSETIEISKELNVSVTRIIHWFQNRRARNYRLRRRRQPTPDNYEENITKLWLADKATVNTEEEVTMSPLQPVSQSNFIWPQIEEGTYNLQPVPDIQESFIPPEAATQNNFVPPYYDTLNGYDLTQLTPYDWVKDHFHTSSSIPPAQPDEHPPQPDIQKSFILLQSTTESDSLSPQPQIVPQQAQILYDEGSSLTYDAAFIPNSSMYYDHYSNLPFQSTYACGYNYGNLTDTSIYGYNGYLPSSEFKSNFEDRYYVHQ